MKKLFILLLLGLVSCSPKIKSNLTNSQPKLSSEEKVALLDMEHQLPNGLIKIGSLKFQDSGFSTDCSFNSIMNQARISARENGANIVKVVEKKNPDIWSSCYRLNLDLYRYSGNVTTLPQHQLTLD
ncbi:hypothetical protein [Christiangramia forsetii]|uniref:Uncharacterized protein n=2 Tax=Christiangramia forsetii TaxID=411153 RepID=A0M5W9_CHRFK|nr:hypothetical protein [Christiangramia forsetii]GGG32006.1 hypothetical protein GCM10011532_14360 [Christiangramia forsetii]CAL68014.1 conserved hypothetical protein, secreted [Christiangramia forsetii KT0803]